MFFKLHLLLCGSLAAIMCYPQDASKASHNLINISSEYGAVITLECNTHDDYFQYVEWRRNDTKVAVIKKFKDNAAQVGNDYKDRASLVNGKDLFLQGLTFKDQCVYNCRTAAQQEDNKVVVRHSSFWELNLK